MKITIVGLGLIGGSVALDVRSRGFASQVIGVELNQEHQAQAQNRGLVDAIQPLQEAIAGADLIVLTVPVDIIVQLLPNILDQIDSSTTVTDMGSTKGLICHSIAKHPRRSQYVASHPMAGTEHSGPLAALRGLFAGRTVVICDAEVSDAIHLRRVDEMYEVLNMRKVYMSSIEHDMHAAYISHLSHISSFVLAKTVLEKQKDVDAIFDMAGGGFESTVRLAKSSPDMWAPIFSQNSEPIIEALGTYIEHLQIFHKSLVEKRFDETKKIMTQANQIRQVLRNISTKA
jgi:prephenate dehydrogenase